MAIITIATLTISCTITYRFIKSFINDIKNRHKAGEKAR